MYTGKCKKKGWVWKKVSTGSIDMDNFKSGSIVIKVSTKREKGFPSSEVSAWSSLAMGDKLSLNSDRSEISILKEGSGDKNKARETFDLFKKSVETTFESADKVLLASKKSSYQVMYIQSGR